MIKLFRRTAPVLVLSLLLAGCGSDEESGIENDSGAGGGLPENTDTGVVEGVTVDTQGVTMDSAYRMADSTMMADTARAAH